MMKQSPARNWSWLFAHPILWIVASCSETTYHPTVKAGGESFLVTWDRPFRLTIKDSEGVVVAQVESQKRFQIKMELVDGDVLVDDQVLFNTGTKDFEFFAKHHAKIYPVGSYTLFKGEAGGYLYFVAEK